jgi:hypothetical protein
MIHFAWLAFPESFLLATDSTSGGHGKLRVLSSGQQWVSHWTGLQQEDEPPIRVSEPRLPDCARVLPTHALPSTLDCGEALVPLCVLYGSQTRSIRHVGGVRADLPCDVVADRITT